MLFRFLEQDGRSADGKKRKNSGDWVRSVQPTPIGCQTDFRMRSVSCHVTQGGAFELDSERKMEWRGALPHHTTETYRYPSPP